MTRSAGSDSINPADTRPRPRVTIAVTAAHRHVGHRRRVGSEDHLGRGRGEDLLSVGVDRLQQHDHRTPRTGDETAAGRAVIRETETARVGAS